MKNYEIRVVPNIDCDGEQYWTAFFPAVEGCVGGGATAEEAVQEAKENLEIYLEYLASEKRELPEEYDEPTYNGKIVLRVPKSIHKKLIEVAESEGVSLNAILNTAVGLYLGKTEFNYDLNNKIEEIQCMSEKGLQLQCANTMFNACSNPTLWKSVLQPFLGGNNE